MLLYVLGLRQGYLIAGPLPGNVALFGRLHERLRDAAFRNGMYAWTDRLGAT